MDMARCLLGITEKFQGTKLTTIYDYFKDSSSKIGKGNRPKKYRIRVSIEEL